MSPCDMNKMQQQVGKIKVSISQSKVNEHPEYSIPGCNRADFFNSELLSSHSFYVQRLRSEDNHPSTLHREISEC